MELVQRMERNDCWQLLQFTRPGRSCGWPQHRAQAAGSPSKDAAAALGGHNRLERGEGVSELAWGQGAAGGSGGQRVERTCSVQAGAQPAAVVRQRSLASQQLFCRLRHDCAAHAAGTQLAAFNAAQRSPPVCMRVLTTSVGTRTREEARPAATPPARGPRNCCCSPTCRITNCRAANGWGRLLSSSSSSSSSSSDGGSGRQLQERQRQAGSQRELAATEEWLVSCVHLLGRLVNRHEDGGCGRHTHQVAPDAGVQAAPAARL